MKIYSNHIHLLPKELHTLLELNDLTLEEFDPKSFDLTSFYHDHVDGNGEPFIFLCFISYIQISDLNQFTFLKQNKTINSQIKIIAVFNDNQDTYKEDARNFDLVANHYLSEPHFALIQKIKIQISNWNVHKIWGTKVLILDRDISQLKIIRQALLDQNLQTICCLNALDAIQYLNKQIKLIIVSDTFALHTKFNEYLENINYNRSKICILEKGSKDIIHKLHMNNYFIIFEKPVKLENFIHIVLQNTRATTTSLIKKRKAEQESLLLPIHKLITEKEDDVEKLVVAENYTYQTSSVLGENDAVIPEEALLTHNYLQNIKFEIEKTADDETHRSSGSSRIRIKKNEAFYKYAKSKLQWLLDDLFVTITQLQNFPQKTPNQWFAFYQKDLQKAIFTPAVLIQFLIFELYNKREYIIQCLNASILCSQILMKATPDEFGEWPEKMEEEWNFKQQKHQLLMRLALCIRYDLYQNITNHSLNEIENTLELNKVEYDLLMGFQWISPYETTFEFSDLARILKSVYRYTCLSTGTFSKYTHEAPMPTQEACFHILFDDTEKQHRTEDMHDLLFALKMWDLWKYYEEVQTILKYPCQLTRAIHNGYKPIKIECMNHKRTSEFQHLSFCKGTIPSLNSFDSTKDLHYCRSGNEKLVELVKKIFGKEADLEHLYSDPEVNQSKKNKLL